MRAAMTAHTAARVRSPQARRPRARGPGRREPGVGGRAHRRHRCRRRLARPPSRRTSTTRTDRACSSSVASSTIGPAGSTMRSLRMQRHATWQRRRAITLTHLQALVNLGAIESQRGRYDESRRHCSALSPPPSSSTRSAWRHWHWRTWPTSRPSRATCPRPSTRTCRPRTATARPATRRTCRGSSPTMPRPSPMPTCSTTPSTSSTAPWRSPAAGGNDLELRRAAARLGGDRPRQGQARRGPRQRGRRGRRVHPPGPGQLAARRRAPAPARRGAADA